MSVHIIIDGYNLALQSNEFGHFPGNDLQSGREKLIKALAAYKKIKHHKITVVYDGTKYPSFSRHKEFISGIEVIFSRQGEIADLVIKRIVAIEKESALVVSSDQDIKNFAVARGAAVINSADFEEKLFMASYMNHKGVDESDGQSGWKPTTRKKGPRKRLSRKKRQNRLKIKKL